jgi:hypothetical protein
MVPTVIAHLSRKEKMNEKTAHWTWFRTVGWTEKVWTWVTSPIFQRHSAGLNVFKSASLNSFLSNRIKRQFRTNSATWCRFISGKQGETDQATMNRLWFRNEGTPGKAILARDEVADTTRQRWRASSGLDYISNEPGRKKKKPLIPRTQVYPGATGNTAGTPTRAGYRYLDSPGNFSPGPIYSVLRPFFFLLFFFSVTHLPHLTFYDTHGTDPEHPNSIISKRGVIFLLECTLAVYCMPATSWRWRKTLHEKGREPLNRLQLGSPDLLHGRFLMPRLTHIMNNPDSIG